MMKGRVLVVCIYMSYSLAAASHATQLNSPSAQEQHDVCAEIQERFQSGTLEEIQIGDQSENFRKSFFVDIDNDGEDEEFQYFPLRIDTRLAEMVDGERHSSFDSGIKDASTWHKTNVITFNGKYYLFFNIGNSYFAVKEITQYSAEEEEERQRNSRRSPPYYHQRYVCNSIDFNSEQED